MLTIESFDLLRWGVKTCIACGGALGEAFTVVHLTLGSDAPYTQRNHFAHINCMERTLNSWLLAVKENTSPKAEFQEMRDRMIEAGSLIY